MPTLQETLNYTPVELSFGTSGLRGLVTDMTDLECYINTAGFIAFLEAQDEGVKEGNSIYLAGDLRSSTPRITKAVIKAIHDAGMVVEYFGLIPTPAIAFYALQKGVPCIMVTGSHIPDDRNGIKFYKSNGEVLKADETAIKGAVATVRTNVYGTDASQSIFDLGGMLTTDVDVPVEDPAARETYMARYQKVFDGKTFAGKKIVMYQHSAVGRDLIVDLFEKMGADVVPVGRSDVFIPIDTENVTPENQQYFAQLAQQHPDAFAIISTDGDSDRPFVIDENGIFNRGDVLGAVVAEWLKADFAAFPVSASDATTKELDIAGIDWHSTKIGSPYVVVAMQEAQIHGHHRVVGWEVNGGFLLGADIEVNGQQLGALPTRDAVLPIIIALLSASSKGKKVSEIFAALPQRATQAGLIDNFPTEVSGKIIGSFNYDTVEARAALERYFTSERGFGAITGINSVDGVRIFFDNGDIAHLRPSGNAPQLRIYSVAATQERADQIVAMAIAEPDGIFRQMQKDLQ